MPTFPRLARIGARLAGAHLLGQPLGGPLKLNGWLLALLALAYLALLLGMAGLTALGWLVAASGAPRLPPGADEDWLMGLLTGYVGLVAALALGGLVLNAAAAGRALGRRQMAPGLLHGVAGSLWGWLLATLAAAAAW